MKSLLWELSPTIQLRQRLECQLIWDLEQLQFAMLFLP